MSRIREEMGLQWILWLTLAGIAVVTGVFFAGRYQWVIPVVAHAVSFDEPVSVELAVEQHGDVLLVRWNPRVPTVSKATHGLLTVSDGDFERKIGLTSRDLVSGMARYAPLSRSVSFQLSLYNGAASGKGSVLFLAREEPDVTAPEPKKPVTKKPPPRAPRTKDSRSRRKTVGNILNDQPAPAFPLQAMLPSPLEMEAVHVNVATTPPAPEVAAVSTFKPSPAPTPPVYRIYVTTQPSRGTAFEQMLSKVPFVKRIAKTPSSEELVKAVRRVEPQIDEMPDLGEPPETSVEVQVDRSGKVKTARFVQLDRAPGNLEWAALRAAKAWRFESPRSGQSPWLVLTFHYERAQGVRAE